MVPSYLRSVYRLMYQNPVGRKLIKFPVTTSLLRRATARHGLRMDDPLSSNEIERFIQTYGVNVEEVELPLESYSTFNDFFSRKLKPGARPIAAPDNDSILVSPADCRLLVFPSIEDTTKIWLKGQDFTISSLLGPNFQHLLSHFHNPAIAIARLAPQDYHRWHMPISSTVGPRQSIAGTYFSVSPRAVREVNILCTNKREVCMFDNEKYGKWCMIAVGAAMVSSIVVSDDVREGSHIDKGAEHGWFRFGGSTLILLFDSHSIVWDEDLIQASRKPIETYVKVGTQIGRYRKDVMKKKSTTVDIEAPADETFLASPSPTSPSLIHTATTDAARKEAHLNDEGLLNDFPYTMQSNLTLVPLDSGDTVPARGFPSTTKASVDAAEAVGGVTSRRGSSVVDLLPAFLQGEEAEHPYESVSPVPAPQVFHLVQFSGDADRSDEDELKDDEDDDMDEDDDAPTESTGLLQSSEMDIDESSSSAPPKKSYSNSAFLPLPSASTSSSSSSSSASKPSRRRHRSSDDKTKSPTKQVKPSDSMPTDTEEVDANAIEEETTVDEPTHKKMKTSDE